MTAAAPRVNALSAANERTMIQLCMNFLAERFIRTLRLSI